MPTERPLFARLHYCVIAHSQIHAPPGDCAQATFHPLNSWLSGKGYCIPWGDENRTRALDMLTDGSCPDSKTSSTQTDWECSIGDCNEDGCEGGYACVDAMNMYSYSLYFSVMTVTSVGYGDVSATSFNVPEQIVCVIIML